MGRFDCGGSKFEITNRETSLLFEDRLARTVAEAAIEGPPEPDDNSNPYIVFSALARTHTEMSVWSTKNAGYYAAGYCGGCETCGLPPHPDIMPSTWREIRAAMKLALTEIEVKEATPVPVMAGGCDDDPNF